VTIADTSGLLALFDRAEPEHAAVGRIVAELGEPLVVSPYVVAELAVLEELAGAPASLGWTIQAAPVRREPASGSIRRPSGLASSEDLSARRVGREGPMDALFLIGRILFALLFVSSGVMGHLVSYQQLRGYAESKGFPMAGPAVLVSGVGIILGGIGIAVGFWADLSALGIAVFLFFTSFFIHSFWRETEQMARITEMTQFQKDLALLGAAIVFFVVTAYGGEFGPALAL
jgi:putative oxidoreductase